MAKRITKSFLKKLGYKSAAQASRKLKVPYSTLRNWLAGAKPRDLRRVERVRRRAIKQSPKAKKRRHPPRLKTKNYSQNELDHLAVFSDTRIRLARAEPFNKTHQRFFSIVESTLGDNTAQQMAGQAFFDRHEKTDGGMDRYSQAFISELENAIESFFPAIRLYSLGIEPSKGEIEALRGNGLFYTTNPQHFLQTLNYLLGLGVAQKYFGVYFYETKSGEIAIQVFEGIWK